MSRFRSALSAIGMIAALTTVAHAAPSDDRLEQYLTTRGLDEALVLQLVTRIETESARDRPEIVDRLSFVYVRLLEQASTTEERTHWRDAANSLLRNAGSLEIRLRIRRAEYVVGERMAERWRLGLGESAEREEAIGILRVVADDLARVGAEADRAVLRLEREEERTPAAQRPLLSQHLSESRRTRSLSFYIAGWSNAYLAYLQDAPARAEEAIRNFGWVLGANPGQPATISRLSVRQLQYDHIARAGIAVAWCAAMLGRDRDCVQWLDEIEDAENVAPGARSVLPLWRIVSYAALSDWEAIRSLVAAQRPPSRALQHLVAALSFEAASADSTPNAVVLVLRNQAIADLVAAGNLGAVVALGRKYGLTALGDAGFAARCVRGLAMFEEARQEEDGGRALIQAADALDYALRADDAASFPAAVGEASLARAQALLMAARQEVGRDAGRLLAQASEEFARASSYIADPDRGADALFWSVRTLDEAQEMGVSVAKSRRANLVESLLENHPDSARAGLVLVQEYAKLDRLDDEMIARLQRIAPTSNAYDAARRLVSRSLFDRFRDAGADIRDWSALRYAEAAEPLVASDVTAALTGDMAASQRATARARRVLSALLETNAPDTLRTQRILSQIDRLTRSGAVLENDVRLEFEYRAAQLAIAQGRHEEAAAALRQFVEAGSAGERFAKALRGAVLKHAVLAWRNARRENTSTDALAAAARHAIAIGVERLPTLPVSESLGLKATLAQASGDIWRVTSDSSAREQALVWLTEVRAAGVIHAEATRLLGELAEASGDRDTARDAWRDLAAALAPPNSAWFEARYQFMRLMYETDPATAVPLLQQHTILYPNYGPSPWGERIRELVDFAGMQTQGARP